MRAIVITAVLGLALGGGATWIAVDQGWWPVRAPRSAPRVIDSVPQMSQAEAESHRARRFEQIRTIEDVLALPGDFAQTEALYALAGRSDSAAVQDLIFQAAGITDRRNRDATLAILFARLTELDPASALALGRSRYFAKDREVLAAVWQTWARLDLAAALRAAAAIDEPSQRRIAAEALLAAHGYSGNDETREIAAVLEVDPDDLVSAEYLYELADRDPAAAVQYINDLKDERQQWRAASLLARYVTRYEPRQAQHLATLFEGDWLSRAYSAALDGERATLAPEAVLKDIFADGLEADETDLAQSALKALAARDIDKALAYLDGVTNRRDWEIMASAVGQQLARADPERALAWAKQNDAGPGYDVYLQVLMAISSENPELAIDEAAGISDPMQRRQALSFVTMNLSRRDPQRVIELLDRIDRPQEREDAAVSVAHRWLREDPDAALSWILAEDSFRSSDSMMARAAQTLAESDVQAAIRWLPRIDERHRLAWQTTIARSLAMQQSFADAQSFVAQFQHSADYPRLLASAISGLAHTDAEAAYRMAAQLAPSDTRDALFGNLIGERAHRNPQQAAEWLDSVADGPQKAGLTGQVAGGWAAQDPAAAEQWVRKLPHGAGRDQAVRYLAFNWSESSSARRALLESIDDDSLREAAAISHIHQVAANDRAEAERLAREMNLSEDAMQQVLRAIDQMPVQGRYIVYD